METVDQTLLELTKEFISDVIAPLVHNPIIFSVLLITTVVVLVLRLIISFITWFFGRFLDIIKQVIELGSKAIEGENTYREERSKKMNDLYSKSIENLTRLSLLSSKSPEINIDDPNSKEIIDLYTKLQVSLTMLLANHSNNLDGGEYIGKLRQNLGICSESVEGDDGKNVEAKDKLNLFISKIDEIENNLKNIMLTDKLEKVSLKEISQGDLILDFSKTINNLIGQLSLGQVFIAVASIISQVVEAIRNNILLPFLSPFKYMSKKITGIFLQPGSSSNNSN